MPAGRPTDYSSEMLEIARAYLTTAKSQMTSTLPTIAELSIDLDVSRSTVYLWAKDHPEFSDVLDRLMAIQELSLLNNGLNGTYNSTITKLLLSSKHDYVEKSAQDLTTKGKELPTPILGGTSNVRLDDSHSEAPTA